MKGGNNPEQVSVSGDVIERRTDPQPAKKTGKDSLIKRKCLWLVLAMVIAAVVRGSVFLYFLLTPKVTVLNMDKISMPDSSQFGMATLLFSDINLFEPNENETAYVTFSLEESQKRLLQQGSSGQYYVHFFNQETGINIRMNSSSSSFYVKEETFLSFAEKEYDKLDESTKKESNASSNSNKTIVSTQEYYNQLGTIFTQAMSQSGTPNVEVKFVNNTMVNLKINFGFMQFDIDSAKRTLQETHPRKLFLSGLLKVATTIIPKVAGFVVNTVRKYGPLIGKVVGGVVGGVGGFFTGGPMGAIQGAMTGMQIGEMIGGAASSLVNACIPQGSLRISCSPGSVSSVMGQFGSFSSSPSLLPTSFGPSSEGGGGGFGGMFGNFFNSIPSQALSNFGFGLLFGK